ncbi:MAG: metallophosphoesterase family protein [Hyphomicrobiales bacterium]
MLSLAHFSDPHLGPLPPARFIELCSKRMTGYLSWNTNRKNVHIPEILDRLCIDIAENEVDHIAVTGDLVNIALPEEFVRARRWLEKLGVAEKIAVVPGNHDAYVKVDWQHGQGLWQPYMSGDAHVPGRDAASHFPFMRHHKNVALIGVSSARETLPFQASGELGATQLELLANILEKSREQGFFRVLMIHHPPLHGQAIPRKALKDAPALTEVLKSTGCELVLHGHNHVHMHEELSSQHGDVHVFGVPSASARAHDGKDAAAWNHYKISRQSGSWQCDVSVRGYDENTKTFKQIDQMTL